MSSRILRRIESSEVDERLRLGEVARSRDGAALARRERSRLSLLGVEARDVCDELARQGWLGWVELACVLVEPVLGRVGARPDRAEARALELLARWPRVFVEPRVERRGRRWVVSLGAGATRSLVVRRDLYSLWGRARSVAEGVGGGRVVALHRASSPAGARSYRERGGGRPVVVASAQRLGLLASAEFGRLVRGRRGVALSDDGRLGRRYAGVTAELLRSLGLEVGFVRDGAARPVRRPGSGHGGDAWLAEVDADLDGCALVPLALLPPGSRCPSAWGWGLVRAEARGRALVAGDGRPLALLSLLWARRLSSGSPRLPTRLSPVPLRAPI